MASSNRFTRLLAIRDNLEKELQDETARRAAIIAAGDPPPTTYSHGGKSYDWNGYLAVRLQALKDITDLVIASGADGGIPEASLQVY